MKLYFNLFALIIKNDYRSYINNKKKEFFILLISLLVLLIFSLILMIQSILTDFTKVTLILMILFILTFFKNSNEYKVIDYYDDRTNYKTFYSYPIRCEIILYINILRSLSLKIFIYISIYFLHIIVSTLLGYSLLVILKSILLFLITGSLLISINILSTVIKLSSGSLNKTKKNYIRLTSIIFSLLSGLTIPYAIKVIKEENFTNKILVTNLKYLFTNLNWFNASLTINFLIVILLIFITLLLLNFSKTVFNNNYIKKYYSKNENNNNIYYFQKSFNKANMFLRKDLLQIFRSKERIIAIIFKQLMQLIFIISLLISYKYNNNITEIFDFRYYLILLVTELILLDLDFSRITDISEENRMIVNYILSSTKIELIIKSKFILQTLILETFCFINTLCILLVTKQTFLFGIIVLLCQLFVVISYSIVTTIARACKPKYLWKDKYLRGKNIKSDIMSYILQYIFACDLFAIYIIPEVLLLKNVVQNTYTSILLTSLIGTIITITICIFTYRKVATPYGEYQI